MKKDLIAYGNLENKLITINNKPVLLASDVAKLYGVEVKQLNQNIKKNLDLFPEEFRYQLTQEQYDSLRSSEITLKKGRGQHSKYLPYVFTEEGLYMVATILRSDVAKEVHFHIIKTFSKLREVSKILKSTVNTNDGIKQQQLINKSNEILQDIIETEIVEEQELDLTVSKVTDKFKINLGIIQFERTIENKNNKS